MPSSLTLTPRPRALRVPSWPPGQRRVLAVVVGLAVFLAVAATTPEGGSVLTAERSSTGAGSGQGDGSAAASAPSVARMLGGLPTGTGMWTWKPEATEGGDAQAIIRKARRIGLSHIYVRTGSSWQGFHGADFLDEILPRAHRAGIQVYGWDFPSLTDLQADLDRAQTAIEYRTPGGHRIDGFVADIETGSEGTDLSGGKAGRYGRRLRNRVGPEEILIACVPNPTPHHQAVFPYDDVLEPYDAIAPMVYWLNRQPDSDVTAALDHLRSYGKPLLPVGQAYDGAPEGGRSGPPPRDEIARFIRAARAGDAQAISFWSWQHASPEIWQTLADIPLHR
jgi:hypothetical protein